MLAPRPGARGAGARPAAAGHAAPRAGRARQSHSCAATHGNAAARRRPAGGCGAQEEARDSWSLAPLQAGGRRRAGVCGAGARGAAAGRAALRARPPGALGRRAPAGAAARARRARLPRRHRMRAVRGAVRAGRVGPPGGPVPLRGLPPAQPAARVAAGRAPAGARPAAPADLLIVFGCERPCLLCLCAAACLGTGGRPGPPGGSGVLGTPRSAQPAARCPVGRAPAGAEPRTCF